MSHLLSEPAAVRPSAGDTGEGPVDGARPFVCETVTPLYYTPSYAALTPGQRLTYNQFTGMYCNELIMFFEQTFAQNVLTALARDRCPLLAPRLAGALDRFLDEERRHTAMFRSLNRRSMPAWYAATDHRLLAIPAGVARAIDWFTRRPAAFPVVVWLMLAMEERGMEFCRRCLRPGNPLEPHYADVYRAHLRDEAWHVEIDRELLGRLHRGRAAPLRQLNATLFRWMLSTYLIVPTRSAVQVLRELAVRFPELAPRLPAMARELVAVGRDPAYHELMYSRRGTPVTFALFDAFPEFHPLRRVIRTYAPGGGGG